MRLLRILPAAALLLAAPLSFAAHITIIESQSSNPGHNMDLKWQATAAALGHTSSTLPQTALDNQDFFAGTDMLIVSSGVIDLPANRRQTVQAFVEEGKPAYIQGEYLPTYTSNLAFQEIVNNLDGVFSWGSTTSGDLVPMEITGIISEYPNPAPSLSYFWYGCWGTAGADVEANFHYGGQDFGFLFTPADGQSGLVACNTDQDWVREDNNPALLQNIMTVLLEYEAGPVSLNLTCANPTIPAAGGILTYDVSLVSSLPNTVPGLTFWTSVTMPNGQGFGPLLQVGFTHTPFMNVNVVGLHQIVPGLAPAGVYVFTGQVGFFPSPMLDDSFNVTKLGAVADAAGPAQVPQVMDTSVSGSAAATPPVVSR